MQWPFQSKGPGLLVRTEISSIDVHSVCVHHFLWAFVAWHIYRVRWVTAWLRPSGCVHGRVLLSPCWLVWCADVGASCALQSLPGLHVCARFMVLTRSAKLVGQSCFVIGRCVSSLCVKHDAVDLDSPARGWGGVVPVFSTVGRSHELVREQPSVGVSDQRAQLAISGACGS